MELSKKFISLKKRMLVVSLLSITIFTTQCDFNYYGHNIECPIKLEHNISYYIEKILIVTALAGKDEPKSPTIKHLIDIIRLRLNKSAHDKLTKNDIKKGIALISEHERFDIFMSLTSEDKIIAIEGLFLLFIDETEKDNIRDFVDFLVIISVAGNSLDENIKDVIKENKGVINEIRNVKRSLGNLLIFQKKFKDKIDSIISKLPQDTISKFNQALELRKRKFANTRDINSLILAAIKRKIDAN